MIIRYRILALSVIVILGLAWGIWFAKTPPAMREADAVPADMPALSAGSAIYTNGEYGFSMLYPEGAVIENGFSSSYHLPPSWRASALANATGTPIASVISYSAGSDHSYPRYYVAQVRVGASKDPEEVAACEEATADQGETALPDVTLNGTVFKAFAFQDAGMMQYAKGVSYRTLHEGSCFAVEKIATGSSYRDDPASEDDVPDATLDGEYDKLSAIIESFRFARP